MQLFAKFGKIICWRPPGGLAPPPTGKPGSAPEGSTRNMHPSPIYFIFMQFSGNLCQIIGCCLSIWHWRPPSGISWIHHWILLFHNSYLSPTTEVAGRQCFHRCVCSQGEYPPQAVEYSPPEGWVLTPSPDTWVTTGYDQQAAGTHPTEMLSCYTTGWRGGGIQGVEFCL